MNHIRTRQDKIAVLVVIALLIAFITLAFITNP